MNKTDNLISVMTCIFSQSVRFLLKRKYSYGKVLGET